jgi:hypothetical protein
MAKFEHLYSSTSGDVPTSLGQGQIAVNLADKAVYTAAPDGTIKEVSNGNAGLSSVTSYLNVHIPQMYHPVIQFCPGYTQAQCEAAFTVSGSTATLKPVPIYAFGQTFYTPELTCPVVSGNTAYYLQIDFANRGGPNTYMISMAPDITSSGVFNPIGQIFTIVIVSENTNIFPWFYLPSYIGLPNGTDVSSVFPVNGNVNLYRLSTVATFGAIPVSTGFPGYTATADTSGTTSSYWGNV